MSDMDPCPFCRGLAQSVHEPTRTFIRCTYCKARTADYSIYSAALANWNRRAFDERKAKTALEGARVFVEEEAERRQASLQESEYVAAADRALAAIDEALGSATK